VAVFVELQTDAFADVLAVQKMTERDFTGVRRPYRGIEIKDDTYAVMKVIRSDGSAIPLVDSGGERLPQAGGDTRAGSGTNSSSNNANRAPMATTFTYSNFIIQNIVDSRQEKSQILETFGDPFIFFFGERPRILQVSGLLMNTRDFNWRTEFWYNYENYLRGTKLVELNARLYLFWDDILVEGYVLGAQAQDNADMPYHIPFSFNLFVTSHTYLGSIGDDAYPITTAVSLPIDQLTASGKENVMKAMDDLKGQDPYVNDYISNVEITRQALEDAESARLAAQDASLSGKIQAFTQSPTGQKLNAAKNLVAGALAIGVQAQNLTFLSIVNHFFKNRRVLYPRGLAGSESYAGLPQFANSAYPFQAYPQREKALRSKIRDNVDEYVKSNIVGWEGQVTWDQDAIDQAEEDKMFASPYDLEKQCLLDLQDVGVNPIQHPGGSPFTNGTHGIRAFDFIGDAKTLLGSYAL
jgi:hypothetical protein